MKIEITATTYTLAELEALCATARAQGFPNNAYVSNTGRELIVRTDPDLLLFTPAERSEPIPAVGDPWRSDGDGEECDEESPDTDCFLCCRPVGHQPPHIAGDGTNCLAVWS